MIKQKLIEDAAQKGEPVLESRSARHQRRAMADRQQQPPSAPPVYSTQKGTPISEESISEQAPGTDAERSEISAQTDAKQQVYNVSRHISELLLANLVDDVIPLYDKLKTLTRPNEVMTHKHTHSKRYKAWSAHA